MIVVGWLVCISVGEKVGFIEGCDVSWDVGGSIFKIHVPLKSKLRVVLI